MAFLSLWTITTFCASFLFLISPIKYGKSPISTASNSAMFIVINEFSEFCILDRANQQESWIPIELDDWIQVSNSDKNP